MNKHLLITNDDGIHAEGLRELVLSLKDEFRVTVVAPHEEKSAASLSQSPRSPLHVKRIEFADGVDAYSVTGTPVDCVKIALSGGFVDKPDLIASGINPGANTGKSVLFSGTVGAVIAGTIRGIPGVAFSTRCSMAPLYPFFAPKAKEIITHLFEHPLPNGTFLNVNFPLLHPFQGVKWTRQGGEFWKEAPTTVHKISSGQATFWLNFEEQIPAQIDESDVYWLEQGFVTLVPVQVRDLTDLKLLEQRKDLNFFR